jgi:hypothetical protein
MTLPAIRSSSFICWETVALVLDCRQDGLLLQDGNYLFALLGFGTG